MGDMRPAYPRPGAPRIVAPAAPGEFLPDHRDPWLGKLPRVIAAWPVGPTPSTATSPASPSAPIEPLLPDPDPRRGGRWQAAEDAAGGERFSAGYGDGCGGPSHPMKGYVTYPCLRSGLDRPESIDPRAAGDWHPLDPGNRSSFDRTSRDLPTPLAGAVRRPGSKGSRH
ncbi:hypothetical protein GCM10010335_08150 [Streptomyces galbus]|nr:hypothetical protein GCM10010335_08150 [Streptomyces galbus]